MYSDGQRSLSFSPLGSHNFNSSLVCACFFLILGSKNHLETKCFASFLSKLIEHRFQSFERCFTSFPNFVSKSKKFQKVSKLSSKYRKINHIGYLKGRFLELYTILSQHGLKDIEIYSSPAHLLKEAFEKFGF